MNDTNSNITIGSIVKTRYGNAKVLRVSGDFCDVVLCVNSTTRFSELMSNLKLCDDCGNII